VRVRLVDTDTQLKAKDLISSALNPDAANPSHTRSPLKPAPNSPRWLAALPRCRCTWASTCAAGRWHFLPAGGHESGLTKRAESLAGDVRSQLRDKSVRHSG